MTKYILKPEILEKIAKQYLKDNGELPDEIEIYGLMITMRAFEKDTGRWETSESAFILEDAPASI